MLELEIEELNDVWNPYIEEFVKQKGCKLKLEHSLVSISKWEAKWHKPYLTKEDKSREETIDYIKCMTLTQNVDDAVFERLTPTHLNKIKEYIEDPMTATWFSDEKKPGNNTQITTSELIYYWMFKSNIPIECQKWHLNRLLTLIQIFEVQEQPPKKMSIKEIYARNAALNAKRKAEFKTKG